MYNFYFTFGSWEKFPFQNTYIIVKALDEEAAIATYRNKYPDVNDGTVCCSFIYSANEWKNVGKYYKTIEPAEVLVSDKYKLMKNAMA